MRTITITNQKGGVAKTTTAVNMAYILRDMGYKVLLIDTDAQCNSTFTYRAETDDIITLYDLVTDLENNDPMEAIQHTEYMDIIPSDKVLEDLVGNDARMPIDVMTRIINRITGYDYVIIDTPPNLSKMLYSDLIAADDLIIPTEAESYSVIGLSELKKVLIKISKYKNVNVAGILVTRYNKSAKLRRSIKDLVGDVATQFNTSVYKSPIRECVRVVEAQDRQIPLLEYKRWCTASQDYIAFVEEYLSRS